MKMFAGYMDITGAIDTLVQHLHVSFREHFIGKDCLGVAFQDICSI